MRGKRGTLLSIDLLTNFPLEILFTTATLSNDLILPDFCSTSSCAGLNGAIFSITIVCEEEPYLLELVRYIHLNPLRAGMVASLKELDLYPWTGHAVLLGNRPLDGQDTAAILVRFGKKATTTCRNYRQFVADGIQTGRRDDLVGGGLKRSQGERQNHESESFDAIFLGCGDFVDGLKQDLQLRDKMQSVVTLTQLLAIVSAASRLDHDLVRRPSKSRAPAAARRIMCPLAIYELGYTGREIGTFLNLGPTGVCLASRRGEKILTADPVLLKEIKGAIDK